jgi:uncharacterized protein YukE
MATIRTDTRRISDVASEFVGLSKQVARDAQSVEAVIRKLDSGVRRQGNLESQLAELQRSLEEIADTLQNAGVFVSVSAEKFAAADRAAGEALSSGGSPARDALNAPLAGSVNVPAGSQTGKAGGSGGSILGKAGKAAGMAAGKGLGFGAGKLAGWAGIEGDSGQASAGARTSALKTGASFGDGNKSGYAEASIGSAAARASADYVFDPAKGDIAAKAGAGASASLMEATAGYKDKYTTANVGAAIGLASAAVNADATLMSGGSVAPAVNAGAAVEASALKGAADVKVESDGYNAAVKAKGAVGTAQANAKIEADAQKGTFSAKAGAMAAAATGEAAVSGDLGPVKAGVKATGYAGAVGAKAGASFKDGELKVSADVALGVGGGVEFSVGAGNWPNKIDRFTGGAVGDAVSAAGSAATAALAPVNAAVGAGKSIYDSGKDFVNAVKSGDAGDAIKAVVTMPAKAVKAVGDAVAAGGSAVVKSLASAGKAVAKFFSSW